MIIDHWDSLNETQMLKKKNHPCPSNCKHSLYAAFSYFPKQHNILKQLYTYFNDFDTD